MEQTSTGLVYEALFVLFISFFIKADPGAEEEHIWFSPKMLLFFAGSSNE